jgi:hypothetical protein
MTDIAIPLVGSSALARQEEDDLVLWSVTTIIGCLDKPALVQWAVNVTAERVIDNLDVIARRLDDEGKDEATHYVKGLRWRTGGLMTDAQMGTVAHALFDDYAITGVRPAVHPELHPDFGTKGSTVMPVDLLTLERMLDQFDRFLQMFTPDYLATEVTVYHPEMGYAGQADGFVTIDGTRLIMDYKTSRRSYANDGSERGPYPEVGLQLAAYRHATHAAVWRARRYENRSRRYYLLSGVERSMAAAVPPVEGGIAVYVTPDRFAVHPVRCDARQFDAFLFVLEAARWQFNEATHVVGNPMLAPHPIAADTDDPFVGLGE